MKSYEGMNRLVQTVEFIAKKKWLGLIPLALTTVLALYHGNNAEANGGQILVDLGPKCTTKIFYDHTSFIQDKNKYYFSTLRHCHEELYDKWMKDGCVIYSTSDKFYYNEALDSRYLDQGVFVKLSCATRDKVRIFDDVNNVFINGRNNDKDNNGINDTVDKNGLKSLSFLPWEKPEIFNMKKLDYSAHEFINFNHEFELNEFNRFLEIATNGSSGTVINEIYEDNKGKQYRVARYQVFAISYKPYKVNGKFIEDRNTRVLAFDWKTRKAAEFYRNSITEPFLFEPRPLKSL